VAERLENYGLKPEVLYLTKLGCAEIIPTAERFIAAMLIIAVMVTFLGSAYQLGIYVYLYIEHLFPHCSRDWSSDLGTIQGFLNQKVTTPMRDASLFAAAG
jgi:hypothetical protein